MTTKEEYLDAARNLVAARAQGAADYVIDKLQDRYNEARDRYDAEIKLRRNTNVDNGFQEAIKKVMREFARR